MAQVEFPLEKAQAQAEAHQGDATRVLDHVGRMTLSTTGHYVTAAGNIQEIARKLKVVDDERTAITKPLLEAKKNTDKLFAPVLDPLKEAEKILRAKLVIFLTGRQAAIDAAFAAGDHLEAATLEVPVVKGCGVTMTWEAEIVDVSLIPKEYLVPDLERISKLAEANAGQLDIPGVRVRPSASLRVAKK